MRVWGNALDVDMDVCVISLRPINSFNFSIWKAKTPTQVIVSLPALPFSPVNACILTHLSHSL